MDREKAIFCIVFGILGIMVGDWNPDSLYRRRGESADRVPKPGSLSRRLQRAGVIIGSLMLIAIGMISLSA